MGIFKAQDSQTPVKHPIRPDFSSINPYSGPWTEKEMIHLLRRITFGATKASVDLLRKMSITDAVDFLIDNPILPTTTPVNNYTTGTDTGGVPFGSSWIDAGLPDPSDANTRTTLNNNRINASFKPWWMGQMINQRTHILEKMTLFWSNHFGVSTSPTYPKSVFQYHQLLRTYGLTNFKTLLKQVTINPQMLFFLSGYTNAKTAPNENYGRELQELFAIGKGPDSHYTEDDVKAAAKTLTGWQALQNTSDGTYYSVFTPARHDTTAKTFSSFYANKQIVSNGASETDALIDMLLQTTECAKFLVRKLYTWFVYYDITPEIETSVITPLANTFRNANYDIPTVLKALFKSEHFFDPANFGTIIKSPIDLYVSMVRELNLTLAASPVDVQYLHWKNFCDKCSAEAQNIGDTPNVAGWPAYYVTETKFYQTWMSNATIQVKAKNLNAFTSTGVTVSGVKLKVDAVAFTKQFVNAADPNALIAYFNLYLLPMDLNPTQLAYLKSRLVPPGENDAYWTNAWYAYINKPTDMTALTNVQTPLNAVINYITSLAEYFLY
ncbi:MAG: DUF1800 domain-containing protein [Bacteroidetes bacterium]|nr:DUF1800 domain-containing protein [Bacteroidota bacterium]